MSQAKHNKAIYATESDLLETLGELQSWRQHCGNNTTRQLYMTMELLDTMPLWCSERTTADTRHALYKAVLQTFLNNCLEVSVTLKKHSKGQQCGYEDSRLLNSPNASQPQNPLNLLCLLNPHLSTEMTQYYYRLCNFVIGTKKDPVDGLAIGSRWLESIPPSMRADIKNLKIITTYDFLNHGFSRFSSLLHLLASCPPIRSLIGVDFEVSISKDSKDSSQKERGTSEPFTQFAIRGLAGVNICLEVSHGRKRESTALKLIRSYLEKLTTQAPRDMNNGLTQKLKDSNWVFSPVAKRVNFLQILPLELRTLVFAYLIENTSLRFSNHTRRRPYADTSVWSGYFHCSHDWRVSKQFAHELALTFYAERRFGFEITQKGFYKHADNWGEMELANFLGLAGPEMIGHISNLKIYIQDNDPNARGDVFEYWPLKLRWLVETLNHFGERITLEKGLAQVTMEHSSAKWHSTEDRGIVRFTIRMQARVKLAKKIIKVCVLTLSFSFNSLQCANC